jgi:hypothetical protein
MEADPDGKSADEIKQLWTYLAGRLAKLDHAEDRDPALSHLINHAPKNVNALGREAPIFGRRAVFQ